MTFPSSIQTAIGTPGNMRIGRIASVDGGVALVTLENTVLDPAAVGFLNGYVPAAGDVVAISGQSAQPSARSASWLVHGKIVPAASAKLVHAVYNEPVGGLAETSAVFVNYGAAAVNFTKTRDDTTLLFWLNTSLFVDAINTIVEYGVTFTPGGTVPVVHMFLNLSFNHTSVGGSEAISGIPAGPVTAQVVWRRTAGAGVLMTDANDNVSLLVVESDTI